MDIYGKFDGRSISLPKKKRTVRNGGGFFTVSRWRRYRLRWVEVYLGTDDQEYRRKQTLLREAGLKFKAKTRHNLNRSFPALFKRREKGWPRGGPPVRDYHVILVRRENAADAKYLLD